MKPLFLLFIFVALSSAADYASFKGTNSSCNGTPTTSTDCTSLQVITVQSVQTGIFAATSVNTVTFTSVSGTGPTPTCSTGCKSCSVDTNGQWFTCSLGVSSTTGGTWRTTVSTTFTNGTTVTLVGSVDVTVRPNSAPVVRYISSDNCSSLTPPHTDTIAIGCVNSMTVTVWGAYFDTEVDSNNVVTFEGGNGPSPVCTWYQVLNDSNPQSSYIRCNLTGPSGSNGLWSVIVTTLGSRNIYQFGVTAVYVQINMTRTLTSTPTRTGTFTFTETDTRTRTETITPTETISPTATITPTVTYTRSATITNTRTNTYTRTETDTPTPTSTPTATMSSTLTPTSTPTATETDTPTGTPSDTPTSSSTLTLTPTVTYSFTDSSTPTSTPTSTNTFTDTPTSTPTSSPTSTPTASPTTTLTPTSTATLTSTQTLTVIPTMTSTGTITGTRTVTDTPTVTMTFTDSSTETTIPHWSRPVLTTFLWHVDFWTDDDVLTFRKVIMTFFDLEGYRDISGDYAAGIQNIEIISITPALDHFDHRVMSQSVIRWRLINLGYGIKHESAERLVEMMISIPDQYSAWEAAVANQGLPIMRGLTKFAPGDVGQAPCHICTKNPEYFLGGLPYQCIYTAGGQNYWAYNDNPSLATTGCPQG